VRTLRLESVCDSFVMEAQGGDKADIALTVIEVAVF
jgi:hypothetical protein